MKTRSIITVLFSALLLILAGCSSGSNDAKQSGFFSSGEGSGSSGGSGVSLEFSEGNPPSDMFKGQPYNFAFVFKNNQQHDVTDLILRTKGYDRGYVTGLDKEYTIEKLSKASEQIGPGYRELVVSGVTVDGFVGNFNFNPEFDYCYTAKSTFREAVCVPSSKNKCDTEVKKSSQQNGPISVTVDRINALGETIRVDFTIQNSKGGSVVNECFKTDDYASEYKINSAQLGSSAGNCQPLGTDEYLLGGGKAKFYCEFARTSDSSYASQLITEIEYKYQQGIKKQIIVEDPAQGLN